MFLFVFFVFERSGTLNFGESSSPKNTGARVNGFFLYSPTNEKDPAEARSSRRSC